MEAFFRILGAGEGFESAGLVALQAVFWFEWKDFCGEVWQRIPWFPLLRKERARMGHPSVEQIPGKGRSFCGPRADL